MVTKRSRILKKTCSWKFQPTNFSGQPVASQEYFNGPLKDIKNEFFITLLSLCDKSFLICYDFIIRVNYQGTIPAPLFDLAVVTKTSHDYYADGKCKSAPSNLYFHSVYNNLFFTPFECIQRKLILFIVNRLQFHSHTITLPTSVHKRMLKDLNLIHLHWKLVPFLTMFYCMLKLFLKLCWNFFILLLLNISWQYQLHRLSDISSAKTFSSVCLEQLCLLLSSFTLNSNSSKLLCIFRCVVSSFGGKCHKEFFCSFARWYWKEDAENLHRWFAKALKGIVLYDNSFRQRFIFTLKDLF